jgi:hypothetical protein
MKYIQRVCPRCGGFTFQTNKEADQNECAICKETNTFEVNNSPGLILAATSLGIFLVYLLLMLGKRM